LSERIIEIEAIAPVDFYGVNDHKLQIIQKYFPKLKLIGRGSQLKIMGEEDEINVVSDKIKELIDHFQKYNTLTDVEIERILDDGTHPPQASLAAQDVLVFGNAGLVVKARTPNQRRMVDLSLKNDMLFALGPAGTGKTYTAVALAVRALKNKEVRKIILTRPAVEAGENLGFLPGGYKEKLDPYLQPLYDALRDMIPAEKLNSHLDNGIIEIAPLAFMRGRTLDHAFVILDEAQNATQNQLKMFLTRMGKSAKFIVNGDTTQIDLPKHQPSGLIQAIKLLDGVKGIGFVTLDASDVIRHRLVKQIIDAYEQHEQKSNPK